MKKLLLASIGLLWALSFAYSNPTGPMTPGYTTTGDNWIWDSPLTPLPVTVVASSFTNGNINVNILTSSTTVNVNCIIGCSGSSGGSTASNAVFTDETLFTPGTSVFTPIGGTFITAGTNNLIGGQQGVAALTAQRAITVDAITNSNLANLIAAGTGATGLSVPPSAIYVGINNGGNLTGWNGQVTNAGTFAVQANIITSPSQYPTASTPLHASTTGTTAAVTVTLTADASNVNFICGFSIRSNATAALTANATVTGLVGNSTGNYTEWVAPNASGLGVAEMIFSPCLPGNAVNTAISVVSAAALTGGVTSVDVWGYKKVSSP